VVAAAVLALGAWQPDLLYRVARCPWRDMTGLACPTCGGTHGAVALAAGRWSEAWSANPAVPMAALFLLLWSLWAAAAAAVPALRVRPRFSSFEKRAIRIGIALVFVGIWIRQLLVI